MIVDKTVILKWGGKNKKYYVSKGYNFTNIGDIFVVDINDLSPDTQIKVHVQCSYCNKIKLIWRHSFLRRKNKSKLYCCCDCNNRQAKPDFNIIKKAFSDKGLILLSKDYKNVLSYLEYICPKHKDKGILKSTWGSFRGCKFCGYELCSSKQRKNFNVIVDTFKNKKLQLISSEIEYKNNKSKLKYICPIHSDAGIQRITFANLISNRGCRFCGIEKKSGENCYSWRGGITAIRSHLRNLPIVQKWKSDSMKNCNYKCIITGKTFSQIHHLQSFSSIFDEFIKQFNFPIKEKIALYSKEELEFAEKEFTKIHIKYPLGVCLCKKIHDLFHKLYGDLNTEQQFNEFKLKIQSGEIIV